MRSRSRGTACGGFGEIGNAKAYAFDAHSLKGTAVELDGEILKYITHFRCQLSMI